MLQKDDNQTESAQENLPFFNIGQGLKPPVSGLRLKSSDSEFHMSDEPLEPEVFLSKTAQKQKPEAGVTKDTDVVSFTLDYEDEQTVDAKLDYHIQEQMSDDDSVDLLKLIARRKMLKALDSPKQEEPRVLRVRNKRDDWSVLKARADAKLSRPCLSDPKAQNKLAIEKKRANSISFLKRPQMIEFDQMSRRSAAIKPPVFRDDGSSNQFTEAQWYDYVYA